MAGESLAGRHIGSFVVQGEIGRGGMGVVYRAIQPSLGREVALKVLPEWLAAQPGFADRFLSEARAAARLHHPNIVTIHDVGEADGTRYFVMELLRGRTLEDVLRDGPIPAARALRIAEQIASALDYAHAEGVVHRDVKPANIMVGESDRATLTDFGIARLAEGSVQHTRAGAILGTPEYMAPEQAEGRPASSAADEYAFACVLFELLAGRPPFQADTPMGVILQQVRTSPPRLSPSRAGLPVALDRIFARALAKNPSARYRTCGELVSAVAAAFGTRPVAIAPGAPMRQRRSLVTAAGAALAAILVMGGVLASAGAFTRSLAAPSPAQAPTIQPTTAPTTRPVVAAPTTPPVVAAAPTSPPAATPPPALPTATPPAPPPTAVPTVAPTAAPEGVGPAVAPPALPILPPPPTASARGPAGSLVIVRRNDSGGNDLFRVDVGTGALARLTGPSSTWNWAPSASPDGQWLAYATGKPGAADIAIMRADGTRRTVVAHSGDLGLGSPWWAPDGRIAFNGQAANLWEIFAVGRTGGEPIQLTHTPEIDGTRLPSWPQRGGPLAIVGRQAGLFRVFVQAPGGNFRPISPAGVEGYAPAWAPDGHRLAFQSGGGAMAGILTVAPDGRDVQRVVASGSNTWTRAPIWSFDGRWIAYVSNQRASAGDDYGDVFIVPAEGGRARQVTFDGLTYDWRLAWLP